MIIDKKTEIGCFKDKLLRALENLVEESADMTWEKCVHQCRQNGFTYAGVQVS